jgi:membrane-associated HD superfamily phosphohydrolase
MICDTVEAASRSMEQVGEISLCQTVDRLVAEKQEDGQFDHCQLTFEELAKVKKTLVRTLLVAHHVRVKYPKKI